MPSPPPLLPPFLFAFKLSQHHCLFYELALWIRWPSTGALASVLPVNSQGWFPLGLTGLISLQSKGFSRVFSSPTVWKYQFFSAQPSLWPNSRICVCVCVCVCVLVAQLSPTLCNPTDCSPPGSSAMGFPRQEYCSGLLFASPGDILDPEIQSRSPELEADSSLTEPPGKPPYICTCKEKLLEKL